eukprot:scaffold28717_cov21-Tisochrysis_lutea.AAC.1
MPVLRGCFNLAAEMTKETPEQRAAIAEQIHKALMNRNPVVKQKVWLFRRGGEVTGLIKGVDESLCRGIRCGFLGESEGIGLRGSGFGPTLHPTSLYIRPTLCPTSALQALRLVKHLCTEGSPHFQRAMQLHAAGIRCACSASRGCVGVGWGQG